MHPEHELPRESTVRRLGANLTLRMFLILGLAPYILYSARQGVAAGYARQNSAAAMEHAQRWDRSNPQVSNSFGTLVHMYGDGADPARIVHLYETAAGLSPHNAQYWADLAAAYEWAGQPSSALAAFQRAEQLFPNSTDIHWKLANFYARQGQADEVLRSLQRVLALGGISRSEVFQLASALTRDSAAIMNILPSQGSALLDYLNFSISNGDIAAAEDAWQHLLQANVPFSLHDSFPYLDALIHHGEIAELQSTWAMLARRFPAELGASTNGDQLIWNGSFEREPVNGGRDWRVIEAEGAEVIVDTDHPYQGSRALRIDFDGTANPYYCHVFEYVPVRPGTRYRLSAYLRVNGVTTESGPSFEIYDGYDMKKLFISSRGLTGTSDWVRQELVFKTPAYTKLLVVRLARPPSQRIANLIAGSVWIDDVQLHAIE
jgi:hypothetical protein